MDPAPFQQLYASDATAKSFFDNFARRRRARWETSVQRTLVNLQADGQNVSRGDIVSLFKKFADLNVGQFIVGRHNHVSRFAWSVSNIDLARAATGEANEIPEQPEPAAEDAAEDEYTLEHSYNLREDFSFDFELPVDLTENEANRLSAFIKTLPFGDD